MPITALAAHPGAPPALLAHLSALVASGTALGTRPGRLFRDLVGNPALTNAQVAALIAPVSLAQGRTTYLAAAFARPGTTAADALELLGPDPAKVCIAAAVAAVQDPAMAAWALDNSGGATVLTAIIKCEVAPAQVRYAAVAAQVRSSLSAPQHAAVLTAVRARLRYARTPAALTEALTWYTALAATAPTRLLAATEIATFRNFAPPAPGTTAWLEDPDVHLDDVAAWASRDPRPALWLRALQHTRDPRGVLAAAALRAQPHDVNVATRVARSLVPAAIRQQAVRALLAASTDGRLDRRVAGCLDDVLAGGDRQLALDLVLTKDCDRQHVRVVAQRGDLVPPDLDMLAAVWSTRHAQHSRDPFTATMWLLAHPVATPAQRARALTTLGVTATDAGLLPADLAAFARVAATLDPRSGASVARAAGALPVRCLRRTPSNELDSFGWLLTPGLAAHLPPDLSAQVAVSVTVLLQGGFHGTLAELAATATAVAA